MIAVTVRLEGRDLGSAMKDVRAVINSMKLPPSIRLEYGGLYAEQQHSFRGLTAVFAAAVLLAILTTVGLSVAAVFIGLWITGTELDISAMMGLTMVVGIVAEIAVFYFAEFSQHAAADAPALVEAGRHRLRPILMTSLITILALMPLALGIGIGTGSSMQTPLAIAIISGLIAAVPLVLLLMPVVYWRLRR